MHRCGWQKFNKPSTYLFFIFYRKERQQQINSERKTICRDQYPIVFHDPTADP